MFEQLLVPGDDRQTVLLDYVEVIRFGPTPERRVDVIMDQAAESFRYEGDLRTCSQHTEEPVPEHICLFPVSRSGEQRVGVNPPA